jgi:hypothetical protein
VSRSLVVAVLVVGWLALVPCAGASDDGWSFFVGRDATLRPEPVASAPSSGREHRDELLTLLSRGETWDHVRRVDGVEGWLPTNALRSRSCQPQAVGTYDDGRLRCGWRLAARTETWSTWDYPRARAPNAPGRRYATERLLWLVGRVAAEFHAAHPQRRLLVGDLARTSGGPFGPRFGGPGHASHQNGLDVDVFYPRTDRRARPASRPAQVDVPLARELIRRFGAYARTRVMFVGCTRDYVSAAAKAQQLCNGEHENHVHVRIFNAGDAQGLVEP